MTQAVEELNQSRREYESHVQQAYFDVRDQYISAETASQMLKIYREGLIPQALATLRAGLCGLSGRHPGLRVPAFVVSRCPAISMRSTGKRSRTMKQLLARIEQLTGVAIH